MSRGMKKKLMICVLGILLILFVIFALPPIRALFSAYKHFQTETITTYFSETTNEIRKLDENIEDVRVTYVRSLPSITITVYWDKDFSETHSWDHKTLEKIKNLIVAEKDTILEGYELFSKDATNTSPVSYITLMYRISGNTESEFAYAYGLSDNQWHIDHGDELISSIYASQQ